MRPHALFLPIALIVVQTATVAQAACLTESEARSVVAFALPAAVDAAVRRCGPVLSPDAFLIRGGTGLSRRYRNEGGGDVRAAAGVVQRFGGSALSDLFDPATTARAAESVVADRIDTMLATRDCAAVSRIVEQLAPLPIGNVAALAVAFVQLDRGRAVRTGLSLCPATPAAEPR